MANRPNRKVVRFHHARLSHQFVSLLGTSTTEPRQMGLIHLHQQSHPWWHSQRACQYKRRKSAHLSSRRATAPDFLTAWPQGYLQCKEEIQARKQSRRLEQAAVVSRHLERPGN